MTNLTAQAQEALRLSEERGPWSRRTAEFAAAARTLLPLLAQAVLDQEQVVEAAREALRHPRYVASLPTNEVVELRMPSEIYEHAVAALAHLDQGEEG